MKIRNRVTILEDSYAYIDGFGRLYFDRCPSLEDHLEAVPAPGEERRTCQVGIEDLVPEGTLGQRGRWLITVRFRPEGEIDGEIHA